MHDAGSLRPTRGFLPSRALVRLGLAVLVVAAVAALVVARSYYGRRALLTTEWKPLLVARAAELRVAPSEAIAVPPRPLPKDAILLHVPGTSGGDWFGWSVEDLGDVNEDGVSDFAVGAHQHMSRGARGNAAAPAGYVRVVSGVDGSELYTLRPEGSLAIDGADDTFGWSLAALDDLDGDGARDLAVGAFLYDYEDPDPNEVDENTGAVFLFSGRTGERLGLLGGERWGDRLGFDLDTIDDLDGDGLADLLVGIEKGESTGGVKNAGRAAVYSSATLEPLVTVSGPGWEARMGHSVSALGDVDGDGTPDFASGAYMYGARENSGVERGAVGVASGRTGELLFGWEGAQEFDHLGHSVSGVSDLDGDGVPDLALGAIQSGVEAELSGVYSGPGYVELRSGADGSRLARLSGQVHGEQFGWCLLDVGDRDGDGTGDLLVGAPASITFLEEKLDRPGRVYLFSGADGGLLRVFEGLELNDQFGASLALLGDLDGDGEREVLIGAPENVADQSRPGYAVVISGRFLRVEAP